MSIFLFFIGVVYPYLYYHYFQNKYVEYADSFEMMPFNVGLDVIQAIPLVVVAFMSNNWKEHPVAITICIILWGLLTLIAIGAIKSQYKEYVSNSDRYQGYICQVIVSIAIGTVIILVIAIVCAIATGGTSKKRRR